MSIVIDIDEQTLTHLDDTLGAKSYLISSALRGVGQLYGSFQTPLGAHIIRAKIGNGQPENAVFVRRRPTGEICTPELRAKHPDRDWILTRILWLSGLEVGKNRLGNVDTMRRKIYIHGTHLETLLGTPGSRGCIRMDNTDIIELFNRVKVGEKVLIKKSQE